MQNKKVGRALQAEFGYQPREGEGEVWSVWGDGRALIVVHPDRLIRVYRRGRGGMYFEIDPSFGGV